MDNPKLNNTNQNNQGEVEVGPAQPAAGSPPPNLGHNGNGAKNSNGHYKRR